MTVHAPIHSLRVQYMERERRRAFITAAINYFINKGDRTSCGRRFASFLICTVPEERVTADGNAEIEPTDDFATYEWGLIFVRNQGYLVPARNWRTKPVVDGRIVLSIQAEMAPIPLDNTAPPTSRLCIKCNERRDIAAFTKKRVNLTKKGERREYTTVDETTCNRCRTRNSRARKSVSRLD